MAYESPFLSGWTRPVAYAHADDSIRRVLDERRARRREIQDALVALKRYGASPEEVTSESLRDRLSHSQLESFAEELSRVKSSVASDRTLLYFPFEKQVAFHENDTGAKIRMAICGNRSGKTHSTSVEAVWWATGTHPHIWTPPPPLDIWYVNVDAQAKTKNIVRRKLEMYLPDLSANPDAWQYKEGDNVYQLANGSKIYLLSQESGREKFQGGSIPLVVWDEEGNSVWESEEVFKECRLRTLDCGGHIVMSLTPVECFQWILDMREQGLLGNPRYEVHQWSVRDNPYIPTEEIEDFFSDMDADEKLVRMDGVPILLGVNGVFDREALGGWRERLKDRRYERVEFADADDPKSGDDPKPTFRKRTTDDDVLAVVRGKFRFKVAAASEETDWRIFKKYDPKGDYILACDAGRGAGEGTDPSAMVVFGRHDACVYATFRSQFHPPDKLAVEAWKASHYYRSGLLDQPALTVIEDNKDGMAVILSLKQLGHRRLYRDRDVNGKRKNAPGFNNNVNTKPLIEGAFKAALSADSCDLADVRIVDEGLNYVRDPKTGVSGAPAKKHDDLFVATMIVLYVHHRESLAPTDARRESEESPEPYEHGPVAFLRRMDAGNSGQVRPDF